MLATSSVHGMADLQRIFCWSCFRGSTGSVTANLNPVWFQFRDRNHEQAFIQHYSERLERICVEASTSIKYLVCEHQTSQSVFQCILFAAIPRVGKLYSGRGPQIQCSIEPILKWAVSVHALSVSASFTNFCQRDGSTRRSIACVTYCVSHRCGLEPLAILLFINVIQGIGLPVLSHAHRQR